MRLDHVPTSRDAFLPKEHCLTSSGCQVKLAVTSGTERLTNPF